MGRCEREISGCEGRWSGESIRARTCVSSFPVESGALTEANGMWSDLLEQFGPEQGALGVAGNSGVLGFAVPS